MKVLIRGPSQAIEVDGVCLVHSCSSWFFVSDCLNGSTFCIHVENKPMVLADISTRSIFGDFQATSVYASVCCQLRQVHISLLSTVYCPFPLPAVNKCWVETNIYLSKLSVNCKKN